ETTEIALGRHPSFYPRFPISSSDPVRSPPAVRRCDTPSCPAGAPCFGATLSSYARHLPPLSRVCYLPARSCNFCAMTASACNSRAQRPNWPSNIPRNRFPSPIACHYIHLPASVHLIAPSTLQPMTTYPKSILNTSPRKPNRIRNRSIREEGSQQKKSRKLLPTSKRSTGEPATTSAGTDGLSAVSGGIADGSGVAAPISGGAGTSSPQAPSAFWTGSDSECMM
ncbi:unnamed protein product, partial [Urochloa humidicola]